MASNDASCHKRREVPHPSIFEDGNMPVEGTRTATDSYSVSDVASSCHHEHENAIQESENYQSTSSTSNPASSCDTTSLFVGGLHPRIGDLHLQKLFSPYGEIVRIHIVTNNPGDYQSHTIHSKAMTVPTKYKVGQQQSKGYAFVEYTKVESAQLAIARLDGRQLMGRSLAVRPSRKKTINQDRVSGSNVGEAGTIMTAEEARREYRSVQSKIEAVKRAIEQKRDRK